MKSKVISVCSAMRVLLQYGLPAIFLMLQTNHAAADFTSERERFVQEQLDEIRYQFEKRHVNEEGIQEYLQEVREKLSLQKPVLADAEKKALNALRDANPGLYPWLENTETEILDVCYLGWQQVRCDQAGEHVTTMVLDHGLNKIPNGFFDAFTALELLTISSRNNPQGSIARIPPDTFKNLSRLKSLSINDYTLPFEENMLRGLSSLIGISINDYGGGIIPEKLFEPLENLRHIYMGNGNIKYLPSKIFVKNTKLQQLKIENSMLESLPNGIFDSLINLNFLKLANNRIANIPDGMLSFTPDIEYLYLGKNNLKTLPKSLSHNPVKLKYIELVDNNVEEIPEYFFKNCSQLKFIFLSNNELKNISERVFSYTPKVNNLSLDNNPLREVPPALCHLLPELERFSLNNYLENIVQAMTECKNLKVVNGFQVNAKDNAGGDKNKISYPIQ